MRTLWMNVGISVAILSLGLSIIASGEVYKPTYNVGEFLRGFKKAYESNDAEWLKSAVDREGIIKEEQPYYDLILTPNESYQLRGNPSIRFQYYSYNMAPNSKSKIEVEPTIPIDFKIDYQLGGLSISLPCGHRDGKIFICGVRKLNLDRQPDNNSRFKESDRYTPTSNLSEFSHVYRRAVIDKDVEFLNSMIDPKGKKPIGLHPDEIWIHSLGIDWWGHFGYYIDMGNGKLGNYSIPCDFVMNVGRGRISHGIPCGYRDGKLYICGMKPGWKPDPDTLLSEEEFKQIQNGWNRDNYGPIDLLNDKIENIRIKGNLNEALLKDAASHLSSRSHELDTLEIDPLKKGLNILIRSEQLSQRKTPKLNFDGTLRNALDLLTQATQTQWHIRSYGIIITDKQDPEPATLTQVFKKLDQIHFTDVKSEKTTLIKICENLTSLSNKRDQTGLKPTGVEIQAMGAIANKPIHPLHLRNISLHGAIRAIAEVSGTDFKVSGNTVTFIPKPKK